MTANEQPLIQVRANDDVAHATLMARDDERDLEIGAVEAAAAQVTALLMQRRTQANATQVGLARQKRDLKNLGMTES